MSDSLVNALAQKDGTVRLYGRKGEYELDGYDCFYVREPEVEKFPRSWSECFAEPDRGFVRVQWPEKIYGTRGGRLSHFQEKVFLPRGIEILEADVDPAQRCLIENPQINFERDWRLLWFDLETEPVKNWDDPSRSRILSFSWKTNFGKKGHVRLAALDDRAERKLLDTLLRLARNNDVLLAWNGAKFDNKVVAGRCQRLGVPFDASLYHWLDHLWLFKKYFLRSEDGAVKQSFALDAIAAVFLGQERKIPLEAKATDLGWKKEDRDLWTWCWANAPELFKEYNDQDVELMAKLEEKTGFIALHLSLCRLCRVLPSEWSLYSTKLVDGRMFQRGHEAGYHFPTRIRTEEKPTYRAKGAFVPDAVVGLHESVAVLDYARMYPSIIFTFNMSLETLDPEGELRVPDTTVRGQLTGETIASFRATPEGHIPAAIRGVIKERKKYSKMKDEAEAQSAAWYDADRLSTACKALANSFYGVILSPYSRFFKAEIGECVTSFGRYLLSNTIAEVNNRGHKLIFGDTDSVAFTATDEQAIELRDHMNKVRIPELVSLHGAQTGEIAIEYEKQFSRVIVTASKRYAGRFSKYGGKIVDSPKIDVRGLELVRSDQCAATRSLQKKIIERVLNGEPAKDLWASMLEIRESFVAGDAPIEDLVLQKAMTKRIDEYKSKPLQVKVAERMIERGKEVREGSKVPFLMTKGKNAVMPDELEGSSGLDLQLYWNQYVYAPTMRVLASAFPELEWDSIRFQRGHDPNQLTFFESGEPRTKRSEKKVEIKEATKKVRRVRAPETVTLRVEESRCDAEKIRTLASNFPGPHPLSIVVLGEVEGAKTEVALSCPAKVASPAIDGDFASAIEELGISWSS